MPVVSWKRNDWDVEPLWGFSVLKLASVICAMISYFVTSKDYRRWWRLSGGGGGDVSRWMLIMKSYNWTQSFQLIFNLSPVPPFRKTSNERLSLLRATLGVYVSEQQRQQWEGASSEHPVLWGCLLTMTFLRVQDMLCLQSDVLRLVQPVQIVPSFKLLVPLVHKLWRVKSCFCLVTCRHQIFFPLAMSF